MENNSYIKDLRSSNSIICVSLKWLLIPIFLFIFVCGPAVGGQVPRKILKKSTDRDKVTKETIHIISDRMEVDQDIQRIVFIGHVMAKKGDLTVLGDSMTVFYRKLKLKLDNNSSKIKEFNLDSPKGDQTMEISKIHIQGNVKISKGDIIAIGNEADYYQNVQELVLQGNPKISRGGDFVSGKRIIIFLKGDKSVVEGGQEKPVKATIYPRSGKYLNP